MNRQTWGFPWISWISPWISHENLPIFPALFPATSDGPGLEVMIGRWAVQHPWALASWHHLDTGSGSLIHIIYIVYHICGWVKNYWYHIPYFGEKASIKSIKSSLIGYLGYQGLWPITIVSIYNIFFIRYTRMSAYIHIFFKYIYIYIYTHSLTLKAFQKMGNTLSLRG